MAVISGGDRLERKLAEIARNAKNAASVKVGFLQGATYPDGTPVALVAASNEFGNSRGTPPRPAFRTMVAEKSREWPEAVANLLKNNDYDARKTLTLTGHAIVGQLKQSYYDFVGVPLKPETIKRKGFDKQLIDTSHLVNSADFEVE